MLGHLRCSHKAVVNFLPSFAGPSVFRQNFSFDQLYLVTRQNFPCRRPGSALTFTSPDMEAWLGMAWNGLEAISWFLCSGAFLLADGSTHHGCFPEVLGVFACIFMHVLHDVLYILLLYFLACPSRTRLLQSTDTRERLLACYGKMQVWTYIMTLSTMLSFLELGGCFTRQPEAKMSWTFRAQIHGCIPGSFTAFGHIFQDLNKHCSVPCQVCSKNAKQSDDGDNFCAEGLLIAGLILRPNRRKGGTTCLYTLHNDRKSVPSRASCRQSSWSSIVATLAVSRIVDYGVCLVHVERRDTQKDCLKQTAQDFESLRILRQNGGLDQHWMIWMTAPCRFFLWWSLPCLLPRTVLTCKSWDVGFRWRLFFFIRISFRNGFCLLISLFHFVIHLRFTWYKTLAQPGFWPVRRHLREAPCGGATTTLVAVILLYSFCNDEAAWNADDPLHVADQDQQHRSWICLYQDDSGRWEAFCRVASENTSAQIHLKWMQQGTLHLQGWRRLRKITHCSTWQYLLVLFVKEQVLNAFV